MSNFYNALLPWPGAHVQLFWPTLFSLWVAWRDIRTRRIPNYLTLGIALSGLGYQLGTQGWQGLTSGLLGLILGFGLLLLPYIWGGLGAGDVKALAALGAWLGPFQTFQLFCFMGLAGGLMALFILWWRGLLWIKIKQGWTWILSRLLLGTFRGGGLPGQTDNSPRETDQGFPYGPAMAAGMFMLIILG